jgi:thioredoxin
MKNLTTETFKKEIYNYDESKEWSYNGNKPTIIDFSANWCQPCKILSPVLEDISKEYGDKINVYKVDVDEEKELSMVFGIRSVPSILFIPINDQPQMAQGALPKEQIIKVISDVLKIENE